MPLKCSVFIATSLDGFIARKNGALDWLPGSGGNTSSDSHDFETSEDYGYQEFFQSVDTLVMGRSTYELALSFPQWPYQGRKVIVLSSRYSKTPEHLAPDVQGTSSTPEELIKHLAAEGAIHLYIDGGKTIQSFLRAGLIQEITITRIPVLIGEGIPLFGPLEHDIALEHLRTNSFPSGFVQSKYKVVYSGQEK